MSGAHLLIGVGNDALVFLPAPITSQDATGRNHQIIIPFDVLAKLVIRSAFFQLSDAVGTPLPATAATTIPITVPSGKTPSLVRLTITGGK